MQQATQLRAGRHHEQLEISTTARKPWSPAGQPPGQLRHFRETAELQYVAGYTAYADHSIANETPLRNRLVAGVDERRPQDSMQKAVASKSPERPLTKLQRAPGWWSWEWWNNAGDREVMPDKKNITAAIAGGDTAVLVEMATGEQPGNETVLVVDDEPLVREVVSQILQQSGYRVLEASGAVEAQHLTRTNQKINLLLTDFALPETNGLELARWFLRQYPEMKVLITTSSLWELANQVGAQERVAILPKPFDNVQLTRMVRLILR